MSMLAERKRKQKFCLNPQGNVWSQDTNSIGQKMLARMGWKQGKGLGRNEDGNTSVIRMSYKSDTIGMGYKDSVESSVQQDNFNTLLKELSNSTDSDIKQPRELKSLEKKSQNSRARVHYKKFTRGKDLSQYSEKDLANIFGKKKLTAEPKVEIKEENDECAYGDNLIERGSMADYFKNKMSNMSNFQKFGLGFSNGSANNDNADISDSGSVKADEAASVTNGKKNKKSKKEAKTSFVSYLSDEIVNTTPKKKKRKYSEEQCEETFRKKAKTETNGWKCEVNVDEVPANNGEIVGKQDLVHLGVINPAFEPLRSNVVVRKHILDTITENDEFEATLNEDMLKKKKKKSKKGNFCENISNGMCDKSKENLEHEKELPGKLTKQKIYNYEITADVGIANPAFEALNYSAESDGIENNKSKEIKRKSKNNEIPSDVDITNSTFESFSYGAYADEVEVSATDNNSISKKKKKKLKIDQGGIENPSFAINDTINDSEITIEDNPYEEKPKKKKKLKNDSLAIDNPTFDLNNDVECGTPSQEYEVKRKGKKKSKGLDNPALELNDSNTDATSSNTVQEAQSENVTFINSSVDISECDIMLNVVEEPVKATNTPKSKSVRFSKVNKRHIYSEYTSPDDIKKRNELFDINTKVIQEGLRNSKKGKHSANSHQLGHDNQCFDANAQRVEESINQLSNDIDRYQAEVENNINESKDKLQIHEEQMIGEISCTDGANEAHEEGVMLRFKFAQFESRVPYWLKNKDSSATLPKRSYKHLIRGDIVVGFKNSNLHEIVGYGKRKKL